MKKFILFTLVLTLFATGSFAADFVPVPMTLKVPETIQYDFDGSNLTIPFTIEGTPAAVWLIINTKGQDENIGYVRNGFMGWHQVNKIDTTVYVSPKFDRDIGDAKIVWDGIDQDGNIVAAGNYDYYLWSYDSTTARQLACDFIRIGTEWIPTYVTIMGYGTDGLPLTQPFLFGAVPRPYTNEEIPYLKHGTHFKWVLGNDPYDTALLQTTDCSVYKSTEFQKDPGYFKYCNPILDPQNYDIFYHTQRNIDAITATILKWDFITDGDAIKDEDWGGYDEILFDVPGQTVAGSGYGFEDAALLTNGDYIFSASNAHRVTTEMWAKLRAVSFDGDVVFETQVDDFYMPDDPNPANYVNGCFWNSYVDPTAKNHIFCLGNVNCFMEMVNVTNVLVDSDDKTDFIVFSNSNGDYFMDNAYMPDVEPAWFCLGGTKDTGPRRDGLSIDSNGFTIIGATYLGITSFGVMTQDGTAIDYMSFADETVPDNTYRNGGGMVLDSGSNYDGIYWSEPITSDSTADSVNKTTYCAFDSVHGLITNEPVIEPGVEDAQAAFAVAQNSPNPFNPATSISFTIPDADQVTVEVYNVAGQKIDTLANDFMDAGTHSVVWDASGLSAGIYFYTVKSGDFSKTMKMTLLK